MHRPWASHVDMYRKIPTDLMEGSRRGSVLSYVSLAVMVLLFFNETMAYFRSNLVTDLALDRSEDPRIRLNFNITMLDLKCDWAVIDVVSVLGTDQNVTAHVTKWNIDGDGVRRGYQGRNRNQKDVQLFDTSVTETLEELHANGEDAISLDADSLEFYKKEYDYVFVDFFASWCSHCRDLAPTWETLAEVMVDAGEHLGNQHPEDYSQSDLDAAERVKMPVVIAKIDCVTHPMVCNQQETIRAYPTLRLFVDGEQWQGGDYRGHRTVLEMVEWLYYVEEQHMEILQKEGTLGDKFRTLHIAHEGARERLHEDDRNKETERWKNQALNSKRRLIHEWVEEEHPGCQMQGHLLLDRAPGNFHILARSSHHDLDPKMTNVSHMVHSLSIGDPMAKAKIESGQVYAPPELKSKISPMDGNVYVTNNLHESYHHYLKIVSTRVDGLRVGQRDLRLYQMLPNSQLSFYRSDMIPEARFSYDLSPIAVSYRKEYRHWYEYSTSVMAIVGGVFTLIGMIESSIGATVSAARSRRGLR
eukprot:Nitzschia sp. Nitz4//scaffold127_size64804//42137//43862//NITZ4_006182-RA/size64804-augustus-gene-0.60-mRNA-1//-1//CDS//3329534768//7332//frame0